MDLRLRQNRSPDWRYGESTMVGRVFRAALLLSTLSGQEWDVRAEVDSGAKSEQGKIEVIHVTAQKREERIQDVPISISAHPGSFLDEANVENLIDLAALTPGLQAHSPAIQSSILTVRGIHSMLNTGTAALEPRISVYQDGVPISRGPGAVVELFDVDRVEILKGPQGALFGRSAEVGAVRIIQNKAQNAREARLRIAGGEFDYLEFGGMANAPLVDDTLYGRIAGVYKRRDGYLRNTEGQNPYAVDRIALRGVLSYEPAGDLRLDLIANYQKDDGAAGSPENRVIPAINGDDALGDVASLSPFGPVSTRRDFESPRELYDVTLLAQWQVSPQWQLESISALRSYRSIWFTDEDGTAFDFFAATGFRDGDQWSQEIRAIYAGRNRVSGFVGASVIREKPSEGFDLEYDERQLLFLIGDALDPDNPALGPILLSGNPENLEPVIAHPPLDAANAFFREQSRERVTNDGFDLFAEVAVDFLSDLSLLVDGRWSREVKSRGIRAGAAGVPSTIGGLGILNNGIPSETLLLVDTGFDSREQTRDFDGFTWRSALMWSRTPELNFWASYARGRRPEVIGIEAERARFLGFAVRPAEIVDSYELGAATMLTDGRVRLDGSIYYYTYENFQSTIFEGGSFRTVTTGLADAFGLETQIYFSPTRNLTVFGNYAYSRARFGDQDKAGRPQTFAGNQFRFSPDHSFAVGFDWSGVLPGGWTLRATPTYSWRSEVFFEDRNLKNVGQDDYGLLDLHLKLGPRDAAWKITAAIDNALDETYAVDVGSLSSSFLIPALYIGPPRLWRVGFEIDF